MSAYDDSDNPLNDPTNGFWEDGTLPPPKKSLLKKFFGLFGFLRIFRFLGSRPSRWIAFSLVLVMVSVAASFGFLNYQGYFDEEPPPPSDVQYYGQLGELRDNYIRTVNVNIIFDATAEEYAVLTGVTPNPVQANEEGFFPVSVGSNTVLGFLAQDSVVLPIAAVATRSFGATIPNVIQDRTSIELTLLPSQKAGEESWKREEIFSGTFSEFIRSSDVRIEPSLALMVVGRSGEELVASPETLPTQTSGTVKDVLSGEEVVFIRPFAGWMLPASGVVMGTVERSVDFVLIETVITQSDFPTPVFVKRDGQLLWVGVLVDGTTGIGVVLFAEDLIALASSV